MFCAGNVLGVFSLVVGLCVLGCSSAPLPKSKRPLLDSLRIDEIDGESLDRLLAARDIVLKKHPESECKIVPGEAEPSRTFLVENNPRGVFVVDGLSRWRLPAHVYEKLGAWLPGAKMNMCQLNGWVLVDFRSGDDAVVAIAIDGGPLFY